MDYAEHLPPAALRPLVKLAWTLACDGAADAWIPNTATPDGCIEIIRRLRGRSRWREEQPETFVAGFVTRPTIFEASGNSAFVALRLWPWAWNAIAAVPAPDLIDRWLPLDRAAPGLVMPADPNTALNSFPATLAPEKAALGARVLAADSAGGLAAATGLPPRRLQRWFAREVGVPPRAYLNLLRFQETLEAMQREPASLADHAAAQGYADQAHMSRDFRRLSGLPARRARQRASCPFV